MGLLSKHPAGCSWRSLLTRGPAFFFLSFHMIFWKHPEISKHVRSSMTRLLSWRWVGLVHIMQGSEKTVSLPFANIWLLYQWCWLDIQLVCAFLCAQRSPDKGRMEWIKWKNIHLKISANVICVKDKHGPHDKMVLCDKQMWKTYMRTSLNRCTTINWKQTYFSQPRVYDKYEFRSYSPLILFYCVRRNKYLLVLHLNALKPE